MTRDFFPEEGELERLILALQTALQAGFSSLSSPLIPLVESAIDIFLAISTLLQSGVSRQGGLNPELRFDEDQVDSLGNSKQIRIDTFDPIERDPEKAIIFMKMAEIMAFFRRSLTLPRDFMSLVRSIDLAAESEAISDAGTSFHRKSSVSPSEILERRIKSDLDRELAQDQVLAKQRREETLRQKRLPKASRTTLSLVERLERADTAKKAQASHGYHRRKQRRRGTRSK